MRVFIATLLITGCVIYEPTEIYDENGYLINPVQERCKVEEWRNANGYTIRKCY